MDEAIANSDPAEGSREVIERELKRRDQDEKAAALDTAVPTPDADRDVDGAHQTA
jgi:hypothetical protein